MSARAHARVCVCVCVRARARAFMCARMRVYVGVILIPTTLIFNSYNPKISRPADRSTSKLLALLFDQLTLSAYRSPSLPQFYRANYPFPDFRVYKLLMARMIRFYSFSAGQG